MSLLTQVKLENYRINVMPV